MGLLRDSLIGGTLTALTSAAAAMALARRESQPPAAALNTVSHWLWGAQAAHHDRASLRYTATGFATNHAACVLWSAVYEMLRRQLPPTRGNAVVSGAAVAVLAYVVDYHVVPPRLTPGYELRLGDASLAVLYAVIAASLPARALLQHGSAAHGY